MGSFICGLFALLLSFAAQFAVVDAVIAVTPPMGWNSYDSFLGGVNQTAFLAGTQVLYNQLNQFGYEYLVVDAGWYTNLAGTNNSNDGQSRLVPSTDRWPSAANGVGFKAISEMLHSKGLKFGIHVMRGIYSDVVKENQPIAGTSYRAQDIAVKSDACVWWPDWYGINLTHPAGQLYYDSIFQLYASWDVDYVKVDCMFGGRDGHVADINAVSAAVSKASSSMLLSLSPGLGATPALAQQINSKVNMYRITDDLWDCWNNKSTNPPCPYDGVTITGAFKTFPKFQSLVGADGLNGKSWPDGDALPFGVILPPGSKYPMPTGLTQPQQRTAMTLWSIFRAPLIFGGDLTKLDNFTYSLLSNEEVILINQQSTGNAQLYADTNGTFYIWNAQSTSDKSVYVAFFNIGPSDYEYLFKFSMVGLSGECGVRDIWKRDYLGAFKSSIDVWIASNDTVLYQISCN